MLPLAHFPRIVSLADGAIVRITRCDAEAVVFDRVVALGTAPETYRTTVPAQAVPPLVGFNPTTSEAWPSDAVLADAIENPPAEPTPPRRQETRTVLDRLTPTERAALFGSTNTDVRALLAKACATGAIRDDDQDFPTAVAGLDALGIIAASRWDALLAP
jgi:hypothetical protein